MESSQSSINFKGYRLVTNLHSSPSFLFNNLSTNNGEFFAFINNCEGAPKAVIYSRDLLEKNESAIQQPQILQWKDNSEGVSIQYLKVQDKWYLVICTIKGCQIWNQNGTRQIAFIDTKKKVTDGKLNFFTCATTAFDKIDGKEFIAVGTCSGEIYSVNINGSNCVKEIGHQLTDESAVTAMSADPKTKTLAVGTSSGQVVIFDCDTQGEWKVNQKIMSANEIPVNSLGTLLRGDNLYVVGFANGSVKIISTSSPHQVLCELSAHSRSLNALCCHPSRSVFATCSDDTFMHLFEVSGEKIDKIDVNLIISSRVNDYNLIGLAFGEESNSSLIATPYDYKTAVVWSNIV